MNARISTAEGATRTRSMRRPSGSRRALALISAGAMVGLGASLTVPAAASPEHGSRGFRQINLVSDQPGVAPVEGSGSGQRLGSVGLSGHRRGAGFAALGVGQRNGQDHAVRRRLGHVGEQGSLAIDVTSGTPTGQVFNTDPTGFVIHDAAGNSGPARFIFDSESGGIDGWNPTVGATGTAPSTVTEVAVRNGANAVYKGLAIATASDGHTYLYAANFRSGRVEAYDDTFTPVELPGGLFVDPRIPAGYAPFNVQELAGKLYVTYAKQDATLHDDVAGSGHGFVDVFTNDGAFVRRLVTRGVLDSPWGLALAPEGFGRFGGDLLVGNFGNGRINAFNVKTGDREGQLRKPHGNPIAIDGLWGLRFGNGNAAKTNELLFSAGPDGESHGLLGKIVAAQ